MQIASNTTALMAAAALNSANTQVAKASERISTGLRINRAADDPAGLGMANRLKAQVASYSQVVQNISQGSARPLRWLTMRCQACPTC
jgi:flagellin